MVPVSSRIKGEVNHFYIAAARETDGQAEIGALSLRLCESCAALRRIRNKTSNFDGPATFKMQICG